MIAPKNLLTIILVTIVVSIIIVLNQISEHDPDFSNFTFDAVYLEDKNSILITFADQSKKSSFVVLEILGMETTYHKEFQITDSKFIQIIPLEQLPKYGWKTTPVTLEITYDYSKIIKIK